MTGWGYATAISALALHVAVIGRAMLVEDREPQARASWLLLLLALPGVGTVLYVLFGEPWTLTRFRRSVASAADDLEPLAPTGAADAGRFGNAFATCAATARWSTAPGNLAWLAPTSDAAIDRMVADIDGAVRTVHLSFYIWLGDGNGSRVADAVARAARRGVACRIAADAIGSRAFIRSAAWSAMRAAGAHLCASLRVPFGLFFLAGHRIDLRNHRKVAVVDGRSTYCGSQNCADPAFLPKRRFGPWVDVLIRYEGPVARQAELIFAAIWTAETGEDLRSVIAAMPMPEPYEDSIPAIAVGTGPVSPRGAMTDIFVACLASARKHVTITTPYFAPDPALLGGIVAAARRGIVVTMVFPRRNDSRIVGAISRAYYPTLARAGVRIFEFRGGLLHAKTLVADGKLALIGSSNMDRRSLDLNFENNVLFRSVEFAEEVAARQRQWLADATAVDHGGVTARSLPRRFVDNMLTIVGALF